MGDKYIVSDDNRKLINIGANNLYGNSMSQPLPNGEIKFDKIVKLEDILNTPDDSDIGYFVEVDLEFSDKLKDKPNTFHFVLHIKKLITIILLHIWIKQTKYLYAN